MKIVKPYLRLFFVLLFLFVLYKILYRDLEKPNVDFIENTRIEKKIGILVDPQLRTSVEDVYAAGDCVEIYHPKIKNYWINFGWPNAAEQGEIAGKNMTGLEEVYQIHETIPFNLMGKAMNARWWD